MVADIRTSKIFPIGYVARATGLSPHVIRAWERRHGIVEPERTSKNRRMYSQEDVTHLNLCRQAVACGHRIAQLAGLDVDALQTLTMSLPVNGAAVNGLPQDQNVDQHVEACIQAVGRLNERDLEKTLQRAAVALPRITFLNDVVAPLLEKIGHHWMAGSLKIIHEHLASSVLQGYLLDALRTSGAGDSDYRLVVATPSGQRCELGALMACVVSADIGWKPFYFGPSLPAVEIAAAALSKRARGVALSIAYYADDTLLERELNCLQKILPADVGLFVGGRAACNYKALLGTPRGRYFTDLKEFAAVLADMDARPGIAPAPSNA